jgi:hypothetical protein
MRSEGFGSDVRYDWFHGIDTLDTGAEYRVAGQASNDSAKASSDKVDASCGVIARLDRAIQ